MSPTVNKQKNSEDVRIAFAKPQQEGLVFCEENH
jgi:hypothetical protein